MLIFRQLFDQQSSTYSYLLGDPESREAILIDPVFEQVARDEALIRELGLKLLFTIDTHAHADHVTAAWLLKKKLGSKIAISKASGAQGADVELCEDDAINFGKRFVSAISTPGHTNGCMTFVLDDKSAAFTGDTLLIRGCGRTDFQEGSADNLYQSIKEKIFSLPDDCLLWPGHDYRGLTVTSVKEEKNYNPRLGGDISKNDFTGYMDNLGLAHPRFIDVAVPANMVCGKPEDENLAMKSEDWAPLSFTFAGFWEVEPVWVEENRNNVQIIDVRDEEEFAGSLGHIKEAKVIPLGELEGRVAELNREQPLITVCRSGARSAQGVTILKKAGLEKVANMAGGMLRWRAQKLPIEGASD